MGLKSILKTNTAGSSSCEPTSLSSFCSSVPSLSDNAEALISIDLSGIGLQKNTNQTPSKFKRTGFYSLVKEENDAEKQLTNTTNSFDQSEVYSIKSSSIGNGLRTASNSDSFLSELKQFQRGFVTTKSLPKNACRPEGFLQARTQPQYSSVKAKKVTFLENRKTARQPWGSLKEELNYAINKRKLSTNESNSHTQDPISKSKKVIDKIDEHELKPSARDGHRSKDSFFGERSEGDGGNTEQFDSAMKPSNNQQRKYSRAQASMNFSNENSLSSSDDGSDCQLDVRSSFRFIPNTLISSPQKNDKNNYNELLARQENGKSSRKCSYNYGYRQNPILSSESVPECRGFESCTTWSSLSCSTENSDDDFGHSVYQQQNIRCLENLSKFKQLQIVTLRNNALKTFPKELLSLMQLRELYLDNNALAKLPASLRKLKRLVILSIRDNELECLSAISGLEGLEKVLASNNRVNSAPNLADLPSLVCLELSQNNLNEQALISPPPPSPLIGGKKRPPLELHLSNNSMRGSITCELQHITSLCLSNNGLETLDLTSLSSLTSLRCDDNQLTSLSLHGALLKRLDAEHNDLPTLTVRYTPRQIIYLNLSRNRITEIPDWLEQCEDLEVMELSRNSITILPNWFPSPNLKIVSLHHNKISELPASKYQCFTFIKTEAKNSSSSSPSIGEAPPPTPPRMPIFNQVKGANLNTPSRQHPLQFKRPAPLPPPTCGSFQYSSPPMPPPPPQFLSKSERESFGLGINFLNVDRPPPIPPLPPHLRQKTFVGESSPGVLKRSLESEESGDDHYEECEMQTAEEIQMEVLLLHHNRLKSLPTSLVASCTKLKVLNVSNNQLECIYGEKTPCPSSDSSAPCPQFSFHPQKRDSILTNLREFYGGCNSLSSLEELESCSKLRVLHAPYNELKILSDRLVERAKQLEELILAGNVLQNLPESLNSLPQLRLLRVNSNPLTGLPCLKDLQKIKVVDASHCKLSNLDMKQIVSPSLVILDLSENPSLQVNSLQMNMCCNKFVNVVRSSRERKSTSAKTMGEMSGVNISPSDVCRIGFAECIGQQKRLLGSHVRNPNIIQNSNCSYNLFGISEEYSEKETEASNYEVTSKEKGSQSLLRDVSEMFRENFEDHDDLVLKYAMLSALRKQHIEGTKPPKTLSLLKLQVSKSKNAMKSPHVRESFKVMAELCGFGSSSAMVLSKSHKPVMMVTSNEPVKTQREKCLHLESCCPNRPKINTKMDTSTFPDPSSIGFRLDDDHSGIVLASKSLWTTLDQNEVNQICMKTIDPSLAARRLLTLSQCYGNKNALNVIVIYFNYNGEQMKVNNGSDKHPKDMSHSLESTSRCLDGEQEISSKRSSHLSTLKKLKKISTLKKMRALVHQTADESTDEEVERLEYRVNKKLQDRNNKTSNQQNFNNQTKRMTENRVIGEPKSGFGKMNPEEKATESFFNPLIQKDSLIAEHNSHLLIPDRSSPSGQSCSEDLSIVFKNEKEGCKPMWPGQMGPVKPSGPFAIDYKKEDDSKNNQTHSSEITSGFLNSFKSCKSSSNSDNLFLKRPSSRNSSDILMPDNIVLKPRSVKSAIHNIEKNNKSVAVFRPFYHFPSPSSLVQINKSNANDEVSNFRRVPSRGTESARSSFIARKLKNLTRLRKGVSVDDKLSQHCDSEFNQFDSITKLKERNMSQNEVNEEQLRSFEYLMARNAKLMLSKDLENADLDETPPFGQYRSVPDLLKASKGESYDLPMDIKVMQDSLKKTLNESPLQSKQNSLYRKNVPQKSRFGSGTIRLLQQKLANVSSRGQKSGKETPSQLSLQRFGSLQNLGNYNAIVNEVAPSKKLKSVLEEKGFGSLASIRHLKQQEELLSEMQERRSVDSAELETRMSQYWAAGTTTCF